MVQSGPFVSLPALWTALGVIAVLLALKLATKFIGVWPLSRVFYMRPREANYTALLMSTGLTFGTISSSWATATTPNSGDAYLATPPTASAATPIAAC
jgi:Kef-type K+ transport system membrane component KefB